MTAEARPRGHALALPFRDRPIQRGLRAERVALASVERLWRRLEARARTRNALVTWDYCSTWWRHFRREREGRVFVVRDGTGAVLGIVPLYAEDRRHRFGGARVLGNVGAGDLGGGELLDAPILPGAESEVARALRPALLGDAGWDYAEWQDLVPDGSLERVARALAPQGHFELRTDRRASCRVLKLPDTFDELLGRLDDERREAMEQAVARVSSGPSVFWRDVGTEISIPCGMRLLTDLHRRAAARRRDGRLERAGAEPSAGLSEPSDAGGRVLRPLDLVSPTAFTRRGRSPFERPDVTAFHYDLAVRLQRSGRLVFSVLFAAAQPIAVVYGLRRGSVLRVCCLALDARRAGVGLRDHAVATTLQRMIEAGVKEVRLPAEDTVDMPWTVRRRRATTLQLVRPGLRARAAWMRAGISQTPLRVLRFLIGRERFEQLDAAWDDALAALRPDPPSP